MQELAKYPHEGGGDANTASGPRGRSAQVAASTATVSADQGPRLHCGCNPVRTLATSSTPTPTSGGGVGVHPAPLPRFKPGDRVHVQIGRGDGQGGSISRRVWMVRSIDTNRTPVQDHEPADELRYGPNGYSTRYAYESDLYPAGDQ